MMKQQISRTLVWFARRRLLNDPHPFNRLMGRAALLQFGAISDEVFRRDLEAFYEALDRERFLGELGFADRVARLNRPGFYKEDVLGLAGEAPAGGRASRFDLWGRRFGLLRRMGIRADLMTLRAGEQVPPHGHYRVVSGFYLLSGEVAARHYNRVHEVDGGVLVRPALDAVLTAGGFTTNSEQYHNIHWLLGLAPVSYLFRVTVTDTPTETFGGPGRTGSRVYVDPTGPPGEHGLIRAGYITAGQAEAVRFCLTGAGTEG
jgi:hypothetical protein